MKKSFFLASIFFAIVVFTAGAELMKPKQAVIPFVPEIVLLDGEISESVWKKATVLEDFYLVGAGKQQKPSLASQQTRVQVFYNAEALFFAVTSLESQVEKINRGVPGEEGYGDAPLEWSGDLIEIFVQPLESGVVYHLAFNPNGARWDSSTASSVSWNGDWQVATKVTEEGWTAEVRLPFACLSEKGSFAGTPNPGDVWKVNICRAERPFSEFSTWSYTPTLFANRAGFGSFLFPGRNSLDPKVKVITPGSLLAGKTEWVMEINNPAPEDVQVEVALRLARPEAKPPVAEVTAISDRFLLPGKNQTVVKKFPYQVDNEGLHVLTCSISLPSLSETIYRGSVAFHIFPVKRKLEEFKKWSEEINSTLKNLRTEEPYWKKILTQWQTIEDNMKKIEVAVKKTGLNQENVGKTVSLEKDLTDFRVVYSQRILPVVWLERQKQKALKLAVAEVPASVKIFRDEPLCGRLTSQIEVSLARGEFESRQLVLLPVGKISSPVTLKVDNLISSQGNIFSGENVFFHRVGYIKIKPAPVGTRGGYWPDPLYPDKRVELGSELEVVLLTVYAERHQEPGNYQGIIFFIDQEGRQVQKLELTVEVFPFSLPERSPFRMDFWFSEHHINAIYGRELSPDFFQSCMKVMGPYRFAAYPGLATVMRQLVIYLEDDGDLSFDFTKLEPYLKAAVDSGLNFINISFTNHYPGLVSNFQKVTAIRRKTGEKVTIVVDYPEKLAEKFLQEVTAYVLGKGWFTRNDIYCDIIDEPWTEPSREILKKAAVSVRRAVPFARIYGAGTYKAMGVDGYIDTWVPQLRQFKPEDYTEKDEVWLYQCLYKVPFPTFTLNRPAVEVRTQFWICWKYRVTGFLYWSSIYWGTSENYSRIKQRPEKDFFVHPEWPVPFDGSNYVGDALFFYPTPEGLIPSLRAVNIRDGVEDWEYLYVLKKTLEMLEKSGVSIPEEWKKESTQLLNVPEEVVLSPRSFTDCPELIENTRTRVALLIIRMQELLKSEMKLKQR